MAGCSVNGSAPMGTNNGACTNLLEGVVEVANGSVGASKNRGSLFVQDTSGRPAVQSRGMDRPQGRGNSGAGGSSDRALRQQNSRQEGTYLVRQDAGKPGRTRSQSLNSVSSTQGGGKNKPVKTVANNNVAPAASELAKQRSAMLNTVDKMVESALGKGKFTKPTDHRGYTALVNKALKSIKSVADQTVFKNSIEAAGKPFGLNFGLSNKVKGKAVALNQGTVEKLDAQHRAEYSKFAQEFSATAQKKKIEPVKPQDTMLIANQLRANVNA
jgi:hypothetical protein